MMTHRIGGHYSTGNTTVLGGTPVIKYLDEKVRALPDFAKS